MCGCKSFSVFVLVLVALIAIGYQLFLSNQDEIYKFVISKGFNSFEHGTLCLKYVNDNNRIEKYGTNANENSKCTNTMIILNEKKFFKTLAQGGAKTGLGEAYMWNYWTVQRYPNDPKRDNFDQLTETINHCMYNQFTKHSSWIMEYLLASKHFYDTVLRSRFFNLNNPDQDRDAISFHYDIGNDFWESYLGETYSGSCAIWNSPSETLKEAQDNKWNLIIKKARINSTNLRTVDIGCGWGYFDSLINNNTGSHVTGITLSREQLKFIRHTYSSQIKLNKLRFQYLDYRNLSIKYGFNYFDRAVSIGMLEHVGYLNLGIYMKSVYDVLKPGSFFLLHYITRTDIHPRFIVTTRDNVCTDANFINKYIFPHGCLIPSDYVWEEGQKYGFRLLHQEFFGKHYAKTLNKWRKNLEINKKKTLKHKNYNETFYLTYEYYLSFCEAVFITGKVELVQQIYYKPLSEEEEFTTKWDYNITYNPNAVA